MEFIPPKFYVEFDPNTGVISACYNYKPEGASLEINESDYLSLSNDPKTLNEKIVVLDTKTNQYELSDKKQEEVEITEGVFELKQNDNQLKLIKNDNSWQIVGLSNLLVGSHIIFGIANERNPFNIFKSIEFVCEGNDSFDLPFDTEDEKQQCFVFSNYIAKGFSYNAN